MIAMGDRKLVALRKGDAHVNAVYHGERIVYDRNLFVNTTVSDLYINNSGKFAAGSKGDRFVSIELPVSPGQRYKAIWDGAVAAVDGYYPYVRFAFFNGSAYLYRYLFQAPNNNSGECTVDVPNGANRMFVHADDISSARGQHFVRFVLYVD